MKLEGVTRIGYRAVSVAGVKDPVAVQQLPSCLEAAPTRVADAFGEPGEAHSISALFTHIRRPTEISRTALTPTAEWRRQTPRSYWRWWREQDVASRFSSRARQCSTTTTRPSGRRWQSRPPLLPHDVAWGPSLCIQLSTTSGRSMIRSHHFQWSSRPYKLPHDVTRLFQLTRMVRSKNAGPSLSRWTSSFNCRSIRARQECRPHHQDNRCSRIWCRRGTDQGHLLLGSNLAIKVTMYRAISAGNFGDEDCYGAAQHVPLMHMPLPGIAAPEAEPLLANALTETT